MTRLLLSPQAFVVALVALGVVLGVSCWPRVRTDVVTVTPTAAPVITVIPAPATATPADIFLVPPTPHPQEVILDRTALPSSTPTPTVAPTSTPEPTPTPDKPAVQKG